MIQKIYDKEVDCYCNSHNQNENDYLSCRGKCKCYCHQPKWFIKLMWFLQGIPREEKENKNVKT